jgi:hypothetical protein
MSLPSGWDVDPRPKEPAKPQFDWMSVTHIRKSIFCLCVGDRAKLDQPITPQRLGLIIHHAKRTWPELVTRNFELLQDGQTVRRKS